MTKYWRQQKHMPDRNIEQNYWRRQNYLRLQNICLYKIYTLTKYWRQQKLGVNKNLAPAKYRYWQNLGADRNLAGAKCQPRCRRISLLLGSAESAAADFSQAPLKISYISLMMVLLSVRSVVKWGIVSRCPTFLGGLSPVLNRLVVLARHAENVQNFGKDKILTAA